MKLTSRLDVLVRRALLLIPFVVLMQFLGTSGGGLWGVAWADVWLSMIAVLLGYGIATIAVKILIRDNGVEPRLRFLKDSWSKHLVYIAYTYGILFGGAVSGILVGLFNIFVYKLYPVLAPQTVFLLDAFAGFLVILSFHLEYGTNMIPKL
jgi:hypothetical protein